MPDYLVNVAVPPLRQPLTYLVPEGFEQLIEIGYRIEVPLGRSRTATGFVIERPENTNSKPTSDQRFQIKAIHASDENCRCFTAEQLRLFRWVADYYGESLATVIDVAVPALPPRRFRRFLTANSEAPVEMRKKSQFKLWSWLLAAQEPIELSQILKEFPNSRPIISKLEIAGHVSTVTEELVDQHITREAAPSWAKKNIALNSVQEGALQAINSAIKQKQFTPFLLHGITGSGKTEVYIDAVNFARSLGLGSLILVPEIALTPQLIDRFRARLGDDLAILHSALSKRARWDSWRALLEGRNLIAIGARSGIFAPVPKLGLIIVDEEHDTSYKQSDGLRYHARDLAMVRGQFDNCPVILGSATPSLETFFNAAIKTKYQYIQLPTRHITGSSFKLDIVDLNKVKPWEMRAPNISPLLFQALDETLSRGEQAFVLYNRRGFAAYLQCEKCQHILKCPNCSVTLTYHQTGQSLLCHYCNYNVERPESCPDCCPETSSKSEKESSTLVERGAGTEQIFEQVKELFPNVLIERLDRDAVSDHLAYRGILSRVRSNQTKILVGTQMLAKGHDLPGVTLVGIADCDVGLHMPDFRAGERVFQLLTQAAGRAGRGDKPGRVILQTRVPTHRSLTKTIDQDFVGFANLELASRQTLKYPPFCRMLRIIVSSQNQQAPHQILCKFKEALHDLLDSRADELTLLGPTPAPLGRLKTEWRWHLLVKSSSPTLLNTIMKRLLPARNKIRLAKIVFDIDPQEMM